MMLLRFVKLFSAESISCLLLTSDCLQSEKEDTMLAWEERDEQCIVSTIVDGIDNEQWKMSLYTEQAIH